MSKLKDTLLMMAEQKETFEVNGKTFQIIEVKEAEQPQPDYSYLVGKFVRCCKNTLDGHTAEKWYLVNDAQGYFISIENNHNRNVKWNMSLGAVHNCFDLTNPKDSNPDEVKKILVPKEVKIVGDKEGMGIAFGTNQCLLSRTTDELPYRVVSQIFVNPIQCELIKCERAELKKGDLAFRKGNEDIDLLNHALYCVIISDIEHCFIGDNRSVFISDDNFNHWYKLQPIEQ